MNSEQIPEPYGGTIGPPILDDALWKGTQRGLARLGLDIPWDRPQRVTCDGDSGWGCRICISRYGLKGENVSKLPKTLAEFAQHRRDYHGA